MSMENTLRANERLREERLRRGWSQQKLADELGIAVVTVNRWERGKQQPTGYYRLRLSALFEKSEEELGLGEETADPEEVIYTEEQQESIRETASVPREVAEELVAVPSHSYDTVLQRPAGEKRRAYLSLPFAYNWSDRSLQYKKGRTILLLMVLVLLIISASITFFLVRPSTTTKPGSSAPASSNSSTATHPSSAQDWHLVLYDPLTKAGGGTQWGTGTGSAAKGGCYFDHNALQIKTQGPNYCLADFHQFQDVKFQIDMSIQQGIWSGIVLRTDDNLQNMYYFAVSVDGQYEVDALISGKPSRIPLIISRSPVINTDYNHTNRLLAEAKGAQLSFWINDHMVWQIHDTHLTYGYIGICGNTYDKSAPDTTVMATYRNAYVWQP